MEQYQNGVTGFLVPTNDEDALIAAIEKVIAMSSAELENMGKKAREYVMDFCSPERSQKRLFQLFQ